MKTSESSGKVISIHIFCGFSVEFKRARERFIGGRMFDMGHEGQEFQTEMVEDIQANGIA